MGKGHRIASFIIAGICLALGVWYFDQPYVAAWETAFAGSAMIAILAGMEKINKIVLLIALVTFVAGAIFLWPKPQTGAFAPTVQKTVSLATAKDSLILLVLVSFMGYFWYLKGKIREY